MYRVAPLLFASGFCALTYETVWLRQLRLVFGISTAASAAVLAVFMAGLGAGGLRIGRRAEKSRNPLGLYGLLEIGVALSAASSYVILLIVRKLYLAAGGSFVFPAPVSTLVRLVFAALILGVPTTLMGGAFSAAARAIESTRDESRRGVAIAYGLNTLGALLGVVATTFFLIEKIGNIRTLIGAALVNVLIGLSALLMSSTARKPLTRDGDRRDEIEEPEGGSASLHEELLNRRWILSAAGMSGFLFFLMELVWYRMLTPILGGTTFTFGLILAVALFGIGAGSCLYSIARASRGTVAGFALTCGLEALFLAIPFALGDRIATLALLLRPVGLVGFSGYVFGWTILTVIVVLLPAFIAGIQFPLLISLLGRGRYGVARETGEAYASNTAGAIVGSLAGGFGLLPLMTAPGVWRLAVVMAAMLAIAFVLASRDRMPVRAAALLISCSAMWLIARSDGPTAFWRHTPIGAGRLSITGMTPNKLRDLEAARRRNTLWETDGVESSISVVDDEGYAFIVNGKGDGHARNDGGTQVMMGLLPGLLHPHPRHAMVVGLGTGTTAGWLAELPSIEQVDVLEIEPSVKHVAEMCAAVNRDPLHNRKVHVIAGDGREFLLSSGRKYDVISSEPSNPYRAGIASLFTREFYQACESRLEDGGIFIQFVPAYEVDAPVIETVYATMTSVFPSVETWHSQSGDLMLVSSRQRLNYDYDSLTERLKIPAIREGVWNVWWASEPEDILARYVCGNATARALSTRRRINTDDRTIVEYGFARTVGRGDSFNAGGLRLLARAHGDDLPGQVLVGSLPARIQRRRLSIGITDNTFFDLSGTGPELYAAGAAQNGYVSGDYARVWTAWQSGGPVETPLEVLTYAEALAQRGDEHALPLIDRLRSVAPVEAEMILARLRWRQRRAEDAAAALERGFRIYRTTPWPLPIAVRRGLTLVLEIARDPSGVPVLSRLMNALAQPFPVKVFDEYRRSALLLLAQQEAGEGECSPAQYLLVKTWEPNVPWQRDYLEARARCYAQNQDALARQAASDFENYLSDEPQQLGATIR